MNLNIEDTKFIDIKGEVIQNATKMKILDIAIDLFSRRGYSGVSIRDITKEVGIKESSLYKHFKSKDEILETVFFNFRKEAAKILLPVNQLDYVLSVMDPKAFLERGYMNFLEHIGNPLMQKIWRILYIEQYRDPMARDIYYNEIIGNTIDFLDTAFGKMIELKRIQPLNPKTLAIEYQYPFFTMIAEYIMLKFADMDTAEVERIMKDHIEFFWNVIKL